MISLRSGISIGGLLWAAGALLLGAAGLFQIGGAWIAAICGLAILLMAGGVLTVLVSLLPLERLRGRLGPVRRGTAGEIPGEYPNEVQPLVDDLNALLRRNREALKRSRLEADNLAHGLKTPLAILANEIRRLPEGETRPDELLRQVEAMTSQVELHLTRARAAAARLGQPPEASCPLAPSVEGLLRALGRLHQARELEIESRLEPGLAFGGDREDLEEMLGNLLDNACRWARRRVEIAAEGTPDRIAVTLDDDGPGLTREQREVLARGGRLDRSAAGTGVGLTIVRSLAELYGGVVRLERSPLGGLRVVLELPGGDG